MSAVTLLDRLEKVRQTGPGRWVACCPAHLDKSPSLSIRETGEGLALLHCFGGCAPSAVLDAIGLRFGDLFPERGDHHRASGRSRIPASDILRLIDHEAAIVEVAASDIGNGFDLSVEDLGRVQVAAERIRLARGGV
jgi:hypothetical protein